MGVPHNHEHGGKHHGWHSHFHSHSADSKRLAWAASLTLIFLFIEVTGALIAGSLALLADAAHMMTDVGALGLAWAAMRVARLPADDRRSFGFHRVQVMTAFINGLALIVIVIWLISEMIERFSSPPDIMGLPVTIIGIAGLIINVIAFVLLHGADSKNLNVKGAKLHILGDMLGSVAATIAGLVIWTTGWMLIDPILSGVVALILLVGAWRLVKEAGHVLLEGVPPQFDMNEMRANLRHNVQGLADVHHLHIWSLSHDRPLMTLHACIYDDEDPILMVQRIKDFLRQAYGISHTTVEVEKGSCADHNDNS